MVDTVETLEGQYDQVLQYLNRKKSFFEDPSNTTLEPSDIEAFDYTQILDTIKRLEQSKASLSEAALLASYRDIRSFEVDLSIRNMTRADYYNDALLNETDNISRWSYNKMANALIMRGKDPAQGI